MKNVALWESADGVFSAYVSCDLPPAAIKGARVAAVRVGKQGKMTQLVCGYGEGLSFTYRTRAECRVEGCLLYTSGTVSPGGTRAASGCGQSHPARLQGVHYRPVVAPGEKALAGTEDIVLDVAIAGQPDFAFEADQLRVRCRQHEQLLLRQCALDAGHVHSLKESVNIGRGRLRGPLGEPRAALLPRRAK